MTKPTPAQIEAAAKAYAYQEAYVWGSRGLDHDSIREKAKAVLTAAAEVGPHIVPLPQTDAEKCAAAAEVAEGEKFAQAWKHINQPAAAEVGAVPSGMISILAATKEMALVRAATIERCAQVATEKAEEHNGPYGCGPYTKAAVLSVAAAIRALKDK